LIVLPSRTQRCALGWYEIAPLAFESMDSLGEADFQISWRDCMPVIDSHFRLHPGLMASML
jgi:hypothetical protein